MSTYEDSPAVEIILNKKRVKDMSQDDKLNVLVDIAFNNHLSIKRLNSILVGDENHEGICGIVKNNKKSIGWLWGIFCSVAGAYFTVLIYHLMK